MLRSILRLQPVHRAIRLDRYLRGGSGRSKGLVEQDDDVLQRIELKPGPTKHDDMIDDLDLNLSEKNDEIREELIENKFHYQQSVENKFSYQQPDRLIDNTLRIRSHLLTPPNRLENIIACKDPISLFKLIRPKLFKMNAGEVRLAYEKINEFFGKHQRDPNGQTFGWIQSTVQRSNVFRALLQHSGNQITELDADCLVAMLKTFNQLDYSPDQKIVSYTLTQLNSRLYELEFHDIVDCLTNLLAYLEKPFAANDSELLDLVERLYPIAKKKATSSRIDETDGDLLIAAFVLFLNSPHDANRLAINRIAKMLLAQPMQFTYKQALDLLIGIGKNYHTCEQQNLEASSLGAVSNLIEKCNTKVFHKFCKDPKDHYLYYYMANVHWATTSTKFSELVPNYYDETQERLLGTLVPFLHRNLFQSNRMKHQGFHFAVNYAKFNIFDERLLQMLYSEFMADQYYRINLNLRLFYGLMSKFRLPFVDHANLTDKFLFALLNKSKQPDERATKVNDFPVLLSDLVLNDVSNEALLNYLVSQLDQVGDQLLEPIDLEDANRIRLARAYLSAFGKLDEPMNSTIKSKLDQLADGISNRVERAKPREHFHTDTNIQRNGHLSNGVHVDYFAVFDESGRSIPFDFKELHNQIDQIPAKLSPDHKL